MNDASRRPLASRDTRWAHNIAARLAATSMTPNQISAGSILAAALAGACFWASASADGVFRILLLLGAALFCQLRLLCNLFDGMVAVEGGRRSSGGAAWNEFPDRFADILILAGCGMAAGDPALGWAAATGAVLTAYVRELGNAIGAGGDFSGPMAKQHRMALVTAGAVLSLFETRLAPAGTVLTIVLWVIVVGAFLTSLLRTRRLLKRLRRESE